MEPQAARSVHLWFPRGPFAECYLRARVDQFARGTYFAAIAFEGGYFGIQELADGRHVALFSLWHDSRTPDGMIWAHKIGESGFVRDFGGEGEGLQSFIPSEWQIGMDIEFRLTAETRGPRTALTAWLSDTGKWRLVSSMSRPRPERLIDGWYAFVEDFRRDGRSYAEARQVTVCDAWARGAQRPWRPIEVGIGGADNSTPTNCDVRADGGHWVLETGGGTVRSQSSGIPLQRVINMGTLLPAALREA